MTWRSVDVQEQRVRFVVAAERGEKDFRTLCQEFDISRPTDIYGGGVTGNRGWRHRRAQPASASESGANRRPAGTASGELRQRYPDWERVSCRYFWRGGSGLPASTIHRILLRRGLVRSWDRHETALQRFERAQPNQLCKWILKVPRDGTGRWSVVTAGRSQPLSDRVARHLDDEAEAVRNNWSRPLWNAACRKPCSWITALRGGMREPHGRDLADGVADAASIQLHWSGYRHPQTQGKVERFHGSLQRAQLRRACPTSNASSGWMSIATNITRCGRMKRWKCRLRRAGGDGARAPITRTLHLGNTRKARRW